MRESLLLFNFKNKKQLKGIQMTAFLLKIKIRVIEEKDYLQPLGYLAGVEGIGSCTEEYHGQIPEREFMVFAGISDSKLQRMLFEMRKNAIPKVDYKAVLTPTNAKWNAIELYQELAKEHEAMTKGKPEHEKEDPEA